MNSSTYVDHVLNTSQSKETHSFSKAPRFLQKDKTYSNHYPAISVSTIISYPQHAPKGPLPSESAKNVLLSRKKFFPRQAATSSKAISNGKISRM
jgi:hypothetical protein